MLGVLGKSTSADGKITRESLTRGGSQEDPQHLQRELQDSMERETDLKDQLKFAEEEVSWIGTKECRVDINILHTQHKAAQTARSKSQSA